MGGFQSGVLGFEFCGRLRVGSEILQRGILVIHPLYWQFLNHRLKSMCIHGTYTPPCMRESQTGWISVSRVLVSIPRGRIKRERDVFRQIHLASIKL